MNRLNCLSRYIHTITDPHYVPGTELTDKNLCWFNDAYNIILAVRCPQLKTIEKRCPLYIIDWIDEGQVESNIYWNGCKEEVKE